MGRNGWISGYMDGYLEIGMDKWMDEYGWMDGNGTQLGANLIALGMRFQINR